MPLRSGLPDAVRGVGADRFGLPSAPRGTLFGRFRHCAATGRARARAMARVASEIRMTRHCMSALSSARHPIRRRRCRVHKAARQLLLVHTARHTRAARGQGDAVMTPTRSEIEALVMQIQDEFLRNPAVRLTLAQIARRLNASANLCKAVVRVLVDARVLAETPG